MIRENAGYFWTLLYWIIAGYDDRLSMASSFPVWMAKSE